MGEAEPEIDQSIVRAGVLLEAAVKRIEEGLTVGKVMNPAFAKTFDVTHTRFNQKQSPHLHPAKTAEIAVAKWEKHALLAIDYCKGIDWKIAPEIAPSGSGWAVYARVACTARDNIFTGTPRYDLPPVERPFPYLPPSSDQAQAVRLLESLLQDARTGNIVGVGVVII